MKKYLLFFTAIILSMLATSCDGENSRQQLLWKIPARQKKKIMMTQSQKSWFQKTLQKIIEQSGAES